MDADKLTPDDVAEVRRLCSREYPRGASYYDDLASAALRLLADRDRLADALRRIQEMADDELRRLGAVPGSWIAQIEADATAALADADRRAGDAGLGKGTP